MTDFIPLNEFEKALLEARSGRLPAQKLLHLMADAELAVPSAAEVSADGSGFQPLLFPKESVPMLACFSDRSRIGEYAQLAPYSLMRMPPEYGLVVNPGSTVGFDMPPEGIARIARELT
jgi:hypothetical protein